jgi:hypothetical protein
VCVDPEFVSVASNSHLVQQVLAISTLQQQAVELSQMPAMSCFVSLKSPLNDEHPEAHPTSDATPEISTSSSPGHDGLHFPHEQAEVVMSVSAVHESQLTPLTSSPAWTNKKSSNVAVPDDMVAPKPA